MKVIFYLFICIIFFVGFKTTELSVLSVHGQVAA